MCDMFQFIALISPNHLAGSDSGMYWIASLAEVVVVGHGRGDLDVVDVVADLRVQLTGELDEGVAQGCLELLVVVAALVQRRPRELLGDHP